jgi:hypothetical protein
MEEGKWSVCLRSRDSAILKSDDNLNSLQNYRIPRHHHELARASKLEKSSRGKKRITIPRGSISERVFSLGLSYL